MHGVRRGSRAAARPSAEEEQRAREHASLARRALALRRARDYSAAALATVGRAVAANPDEYSLWAFRREALLRRAAAPRGRAAALADAWRADLDLAFAALARHPKAYPAWQHRLWLLSDTPVTRALPEGARASALAAEFAMSGVLLARDGRNFHGWAHRMRVRAAAPDVRGSAPADELAFVTAKINADFANYSAWHHRSVILPVLNRGCGGGERAGGEGVAGEGVAVAEERKDAFVADELEFVRQAFYTEPDVQSAWFYHRWLLAGAPARGASAVVRDDVWNEELAACRELLDIEPGARWALHAEADLLSRLGQHKDAVGVYEQLVVLDPMRRGFYCEKIANARAASTSQ